MAPEYRAVVLLQRLLRGRAAQNEMRAGVERRASSSPSLGRTSGVVGRRRRRREGGQGLRLGLGRARSVSRRDPTSSLRRTPFRFRRLGRGILRVDSDADAELAASVARATARALAVPAIPDAEARATAFASTEAAAARAAAELAPARGAATAIQAAHRGASERRRLGLERLERLERERKSASTREEASLTALAEAESRREKGGLVGDVDEAGDSVSEERKNLRVPPVDVDALSSPDVASLTRVQLAAKEWVEREIRLDFLLAEAEAAAAEIPADVAADPRVAQLQRSAREHVRATAERRALARDAGDEALASAPAALVESPSVAARAARRARASQSRARLSRPTLRRTPKRTKTCVRVRPRARCRARRVGICGTRSARAKPFLCAWTMYRKRSPRRCGGFRRPRGSWSVRPKTKTSSKGRWRTRSARPRRSTRRGTTTRAWRASRRRRAARARRGGGRRRRDAARIAAAAASVDPVEAAFSTAAEISGGSSTLPAVVVEVDADLADAAEAFVGTPREQAAARVIQSAHRRAEARKKNREARRRREDPEYRSAMEAAELERAAIAAQAARRGSVARRSVAEMRMQLEAEARGAEEEDEEEV